MSWWRNASREQKLAHIDAAIALDMTAKQVAMNAGATANAVNRYALHHGRHFHGSSAPQKRAQKANAIVSLKGGKVLRRREAVMSAAKRAFLAGEPVDFWSVP